MREATENGSRRTDPSPPAEKILAGGSPGIPHWCLVLLGFGFTPLLATFFFNLWKQPEYQFFPQALAAAGFLAWDRLREVPRGMLRGKPAPAAVLLLLSLTMLALAVLVWSPWLAIVASLPAGIAVLWLIGGGQLLRNAAPAMVMVLTIIPPPLGLDLRLGLFLRELATILSSRTLDLLGVIHSVSGNVIELPGQKLLVEEACSGINSVLFVTAFCLFYLFWRRRPLWCFLICLPASLAFVVMGNVVRISLGASLRYYKGIDLLTGWKHETESIILVALYVLLVVSLESLFPRSKTGDRKALPPAAGLSSPLNFPVWFKAACAVFAALGVLSTFQVWEKSNEGIQPLRAADSRLADGAVFSLPGRIGDWSRSETGPPTVNKIETLGLSSAIWNFQRPGMQAVIAFDYPIWRYHDVEGCYSNNGWTVERKEIFVPKTGAPPRFQMEMKKDPGIRGTLWFATINEKGEWVDQATVKHDFISRIGLFEGPQETTYRVQLLLAGDKAPDAAAIEAMTQLFEEASDILSRQMLQQIRK
ncbi:MAG: exosortase U [Verrucomicrobia bacterium]|nr:exosortase U [Verrucomicrobiota bacterium]